MNIDKTTCWYDKKITPKEMVKGSKGILWPVLEKSDHFPILKRLIELIPNEYVSFLDLGCGSGDLGRIIGHNFFYTGADLEHIINNVARVVNPSLKYIEFDFFSDGVELLSEFDIVCCNAFIDILQFPIESLESILSHMKEDSYFVLHRQRISHQRTEIVINSSYGGKTFQSIVNRNEFDNILKLFKCSVVKEINLFDDSKSFLIKRN